MELISFIENCMCFLLRMLPEYVAGYGIFLKYRATFTPHMVMA
jgi:hypothetical protein